MTIEIMPEKAYYKLMGNRLRLLIQALDLTPTEAAKEMGISKQRLHNWLNNGSPPDLYKLYRWMRRRSMADTNFITWGDWQALPSRVSKRVEEALLHPQGGGEIPGSEVEKALDHQAS